MNYETPCTYFLSILSCEGHCCVRRSRASDTTMRYADTPRSSYITTSFSISYCDRTKSMQSLEWKYPRKPLNWLKNSLSLCMLLSQCGRHRARCMMSCFENTGSFRFGVSKHCTSSTEKLLMEQMLGFILGASVCDSIVEILCVSKSHISLRYLIRSIPFITWVEIRYMPRCI